MSATPALEILRHPESPQASTLVVLVPGAYMTPRHFIDAGFVQVLDESGMKADLALPTIDLPAITDGSALPLLRQEVIGPARARGYQSIWLGGISLGGFMALAYASEYPQEVDGLCLLAPYPGSRITTNEITDAGGLETWQATDGHLEDPEFRVWHWLKSRPADLPVFCGYGTEDRFAGGMAMLADALQPQSLHTLPGGHEWPVWQSLWRHFLAAGRLEPVA